MGTGSGVSGAEGVELVWDCLGFASGAGEGDGGGENQGGKACLK